VNSVIIRTAARLMLPLLLLFSVYLLLRGHNEPGGGFVGGLVAASALILLALAGGVSEVEAVIAVELARSAMAVGLFIAGGSALLPLFMGMAFMEGIWLSDYLAPSQLLTEFDFGTPLLFDIGVDIVVLGMVITVVLRLMGEVEEWKS
jgi:multicomponent Na+:H+ antiporter subunit B